MVFLTSLLVLEIDVEFFMNSLFNKSLFKSFVVAHFCAPCAKDGAYLS